LAVAAVLWIGFFGLHRKAAATSVLLQSLKVFGILAAAPLAEEPLFRGLLYGGYRRSFGPIWAAVLTTAMFCMLHSSQTFQFPPALVGIAGGALVMLWTRLRYAAIGPAIAVHFGYNAVALALSAVPFR
jgi:membrane protease YdiL (CAAX protease family)